MTTEDLDRWGVRIARCAAPDERDFAGHVTRAYAAGGTARRDLFRTTGHAPGGLGGGLVTVLPDVLDALAYGADAVRSALGSQEFGNAVSAAALLAGLRAQRGGRTDAAARPLGTDGAERSAAGPSAAAMRAALRLYDRLRARGLDGSEAERLACDLLAELLAAPDPADAAAFLNRLVANEVPAPSVPGPRRTRRLLGRLVRRRPDPT